VVAEEDDGGVAGIGVTRLPDLGSRGQGWVWLQALLMFLVVLGSLGPQWPDVVATAFLIVGTVLFLGAAAQLAFGILAVGASFGVPPRPGADASLRTTGLLARTRHPIYGGWMLGAVGWTLVFSPWSVLPAALLILELDGKRRVEERMLVRSYPGYASYAQHVRRPYLVIP
jgi:protein-S-isoprenylcysteine O-methyltransferase Ste14